MEWKKPIGRGGRQRESDSCGISEKMAARFARQDGHSPRPLQERHSGHATRAKLAASAKLRRAWHPGPRPIRPRSSRTTIREVRLPRSALPPDRAPRRGAYVPGALPGFGIMAAPAAGELLAAWLTGTPSPTTRRLHPRALRRSELPGASRGRRVRRRGAVTSQSRAGGEGRNDHQTRRWDAGEHLQPDEDMAA